VDSDDIGVDPFVRPFSVWFEVRRVDALDIAVGLVPEPDFVDEDPEHVWLVVRDLRHDAAKTIFRRASTEPRILTARMLDGRGDLVHGLGRRR
jgi:hypothetical protein